MADLHHIHGHDLQLSAVGGLLLSSGTEQGQQKIIRRLMTNPGDDQWSPEYGGGAPAFIGSTASVERIRAAFFKQMRLEAFVDQSVAPEVHVRAEPATGTTHASIRYRDAVTGETSLLNLPMGTANGS